VSVDTAYELVFPVADVKQLISANDRGHWSKNHRKTKQWRQTAQLVASSARNRGHLPLMERARIEVWFTYPTNHRRDVANLHPTVKALVDGVVDAGILPDDNDKHVLGPDCRRDPEKGPLSMRMVITPLVPA
jgi:Holliday junction resolvase RusA-like endonuclease